MPTVTKLICKRFDVFAEVAAANGGKAARVPRGPKEPSRISKLYRIIRPIIWIWHHKLLRCIRLTG